MHLKMGTADGLDSFDGSTNWSGDGEGKQDNSLTFTRHPLIAAHIRTKIDLIAETIRTRQAIASKITMTGSSIYVAGNTGPG